MKKVDIVFVIKVENIDVVGYKLCKSGKLVKKSNVKNVELIEVCFNIIDNVVIDFGIEFFYVCIINLLGEILVMEELGFGIFINSVMGE